MKSILQHLPWLLLLLGIDAFAALLLWLADTAAFYPMITVILLATVLLFLSVCWFVIRLEQRKEQAFSDFIHNPDAYHEELLLQALPSAQEHSIRLLGQILRDHQTAYAGLQTQLDEYEEYVESWAHETKTPLSLLTLLLDNRREELPASICLKLDHIRNRMQESIDQILFYARLKGMRKDYLFERIPVRNCIEDVLEDYRPLLEEKRFQVSFSLPGPPDDTVYSDRRGLHFLLCQIVSNSIKYCKAEPELSFTASVADNHYVLCIRDNGMGVRSCDLPYIFEKGFTGDSGNDKKQATGMGLYLAKEMADDLSLSLCVNSRREKGFEMQISFPVVKQEYQSFILSPIHRPPQ